MPSEQHNAAFAAFQQSFQYDSTTFLTHPQNIPKPLARTRHDSVISAHTSSPQLQADAQDFGQDEIYQRSSSEEKDSMKPAQSRRKAQNRAAQRAFRERKERHVKELEAKLDNLEKQLRLQSAENERLRRELARFATENEILRATSANDSHVDIDEAMTTGPMRYSPTDFSPVVKARRDQDDTLGPGKRNLSHQPIDISEDTGKAWLSASATWDYVQEHELLRKGRVDVGAVCERLKKFARCDGRGPVFQESDVHLAITQNAVVGVGDELI